MKFGDHQTFLEAYIATTTIQNITVDLPFIMDACMPGSNIDDVQVEIASDSNNAFSTGGAQGFLVRPKFEPLIPGYQDYGGSLKFYPGVCIRTISMLAGDASFADDNVMMVTSCLPRV